MKKIAENAIDLIGNTPMLKLKRYSGAVGCINANLYAKLEYLNPAGSIKDRAALSMIQEAVKEGVLKKGGTIIEPTSGNTGIGLAMVSAILGYRVILTLPETMSVERRTLLAAYGAEIVITKGEDGMAGAIKKAQELNEQIEGSVILGQFENPSNAKAHIDTTGPEIWEQMDGDVDILVATVGTGGTITGIGRYLKSKNPNIKVIAVEPSGSPVLSEGKAGKHNIQGIGAGFIPEVLDRSVYDEIITVDDEAAYENGRKIALTEGILVGISSGAALKAACEIAARKESAGKNIVVVLPDSGDRYLSTEMFKN